MTLIESSFSPTCSADPKAAQQLDDSPFSDILRLCQLPEDLANNRNCGKNRIIVSFFPKTAAGTAENMKC